MKKLLRITAKGETIIFRGRVVRTPTEILLTDDEYIHMKSQLRTKGITEEFYSLSSSLPKVKKQKIITNVKSRDHGNTHPKIEEPISFEDLTYLERLAAK